MFCHLIDYTLEPVAGTLANYTTPMNTKIATSISCPIFSRYDNCNFTQSMSNNTCDNQGGVVFLSCREG